MSETNYKIDKKFNNLKLSVFLSFYHLGKEKIKKCDFFINNNYASENSILKNGDILTIKLEESIDFICENKPIDILYEDEYLLVVNKPAGLMVHPDSKDKKGCLVNYIASYYKNNGIERSIKYLHRIDTDTSGIVIVAKDILTQSYFNYLISIHEIRRTYLAIVNGVLEGQGEINYKIGSDRHVNGKRRVSNTGQEAITYYEFIKKAKFGNSLVKAVLKTGRTHQIRVHFSYIGHPILGDVLYGGNLKYIKRQALHSYMLDFLEPYSFKPIHIEASIPSDMEKLL